MMGRTHQVIGATLTTGLYLTSTVPIVSADFVAALAISLLASVLPDIDATNSDRGDPTARRMLGIGNRQADRNITRASQSIMRSKGISGFVINIIYWLFTILWRGVVFGINSCMKLLGHRGLTHWGITWLAVTAIASLLAAALSSIAPVQSTYLIALAFSLSYGSHLAGDMATKSGLTIFAPFSQKRYHVIPKHLTLTTGSFAESILFVMVCLVWLSMMAVYTLIGSNS